MQSYWCSIELLSIEKILTAFTVTILQYESASLFNVAFSGVTKKFFPKIKTETNVEEKKKKRVEAHHFQICAFTSKTQDIHILRKNQKNWSGFGLNRSWLYFWFFRIGVSIFVQEFLTFDFWRLFSSGVFTRVHFRVSFDLNISFERDLRKDLFSANLRSRAVFRTFPKATRQT